MKKTALRSALALAVLLALASSPSWAQFYVGLRGGLSNQNVKAGDIEFDRDSAFLYGGQIGFKLLSFAVQGEFYRADHNLLSGGDTMDNPELDYYYLGVNGKLGIPLVVIYPYITGGYGRYSVKLTDIARTSKGGFNIGAGAELTLGRVGIFAELRYNDFKMDLDNQSWDFGGLDLHAGLNIYF